MDPGLSLLAIPASASALGFAKQTATAAAEPFQALLQAAMGRAEPAGGAATSDDGGSGEGDAIGEQLVRQLQELLASLGATEGESVSLNINGAGDISVAGDAELAAGVEEALRNDSALAENIRLLAEQDGALDDAAWFGGAELRITAARDGAEPELEWR